MVGNAKEQQVCKHTRTYTHSGSVFKEQLKARIVFQLPGQNISEVPPGKGNFQEPVLFKNANL